MKPVFSKTPKIVNVEWGPVLYFEQIGIKEEIVPIAWAEFWKRASEVDRSLVRSFLVSMFRDKSKKNVNWYNYKVGVALNQKINSDQFQELEVSELKGGKYARFSYIGPREELECLYEHIHQNLEGKMFEPRNSASLEVYVNSAKDTPSHLLKTKVYIPIY